MKQHMKFADCRYNMQRPKSFAKQQLAAHVRTAKHTVADMSMQGKVNQCSHEELPEAISVCSVYATLRLRYT